MEWREQDIRLAQRLLCSFCGLGPRFSLLSDLMLMLQTHESLEEHS